VPAWRGIIEYLADRYRFITWDYRGLYDSGRPAPDVASAYAIPKHVEDLAALLAAERVERASLVGWSMGVQVSLEAVRQGALAIANLVLINGTYGNPLATLTPIRSLGAVLPPLVDLARHAHKLATDMARRATSQPETIAWFKRLGLVGPTLDAAVFAELVHELGRLDMEPFFRNLRAIGAHDAEAVLEAIDVPTLVVTGDRDLFTPRALAQQMARRIPRAEILVVRGGTHYTCVEFPELVSLRIEKFFREHAY
jgi:pimeloyl-ACP methyl ester carboxylesterase